jgi:hypothetical protein
LLSYYRTPPLLCDNEEDQFTFLQTKTASLIMFSAFLRIHETTIISLEGMKISRECIWVHTILKSKQDFLTPIAIPFFYENQAICPASTMLSLIQANQAHFGKPSSSLFLDWTSGSPLLTRNVATLLRNLFKELKLPKEFGPYTIKHAVITYLTNHGVKMEEINDIAHFAKGSLVLKNHYAISDPQRRIHSLISNAMSSEPSQESTSISSYTSPSLLLPSLDKSGESSEFMSNSSQPSSFSYTTLSKDGISSEIISNLSLPSSISSITSPKVINLTNVKENIFNNGEGVGNSNSKQFLESRKIFKSSKGVKSKQLDLLSPEYLTAKLNNEKVINVKHPSLLPRSKPNRNPSQVSSYISSNDEISLFSDSNSDSKSDSSVFSLDSHVSEEKTDWVN